jgi:hypothetical protein
MKDSDIRKLVDNEFIEVKKSILAYKMACLLYKEIAPAEILHDTCHSILDRFSQALTGKVILVEDLPTVEEIAEVISKTLFNENLNEDTPVRNLEIYGLAQSIHKLMMSKEEATDA